MRHAPWIAIGALGVACVASGLAACGGDSTTSTSTGTGGGSTSTATATSTTTATSTATSTGTGVNLINGCDPAVLEDMTGMAAVTITFGGMLGNKYDHPCIKVKSGTMVTFSGSFPTHPLSGGVAGMADAASPIKETLMGTTATFAIAPAGTYPYFCEDHFGGGMAGAIFAE